MPACSFCGGKAVFCWNGRCYCKKHFKEWVEGFIYRKLEELLKPFNSFAVAVSGGKDSTLLLLVAKRYAKATGKKLWALAIDEGIEGYRNVTLKFLKDFCKKEQIPLKILSFKEFFGMSLDEAVKIARGRIQACTICGAWRRKLLNLGGKLLGVDALLVAHNMDDEVQTFFMNLTTGNAIQMARRGEIVGIKAFEGFVPRVKPMLFIPEKATALYNLLFLKAPDVECPYRRESMRWRIRFFVYELEELYPGAMEKILNFAIKRAPELLKSKVPHRVPRPCRICGEPTSGAVCKACEIEARLRDLKVAGNFTLGGGGGARSNARD